jgi:simple sugar transport system permease protein
MMEGFFDVFTIQLLNSGIRLATPIILAAMGGVIAEQSGVLNLALEGKMLLGAFLGIVMAYFLGNTYLGILVAMVAGGLLGLIFAVLYHKYEVNLIILAIALNMIILELTVYLTRVLFGQVGTWSDPSIVRLPDLEIPLIKDIPMLGELLSGYNAIVYFSWFISIVLYIVLFHTKFGRHIRAVGENREAAETVGINSRRIQTISLILSGMLAALGGAFLSVGHLKLFTRNMSNNRGWTAIAAVLFGVKHPIYTFLASLFFGFADAFAVRVQNVTDLSPNLVELLPNFATLLVLVLVATREKIQVALARARFRSKLKQAEAISETPDLPSS